MTYIFNGYDDIRIVQDSSSMGMCDAGAVLCWAVVGQAASKGEGGGEEPNGHESENMGIRQITHKRNWPNQAKTAWWIIVRRYRVAPATLI